CTAEQALQNVWIRDRAPQAKDVGLPEPRLTAELRETFQALDLQGDGVLPVAQLREALLQARVARVVRVAIRGGVVSVESGGEGFEVVERQAEAGVKESVVEEL
ncbi:unnamed protein product, partial [Durusdinium trenchii]